MDDHGRNTTAMFRQDVLHELRIIHIGEAFVVHHDVIPFGPSGLFINAYAMLGPVPAFLNNLPRDFRARVDALGNNYFLLVVIVAATAGDIESLERFGIGGKAHGCRSASESDERK